jgi:hypothetical protein
MLKWASDETKKLYPDTEFAMKAANAEIKGLLAVSQCNIPGVHFPLLAIVGIGELYSTHL